jgi:hypothetical protein
MLPVSADSPKSDSLQPYGQPEQQFPDASEAGQEFDAHCQCGFGQSTFGATSTEFPARRSSPLAQRFTPKLFRFDRQSSSLVIVELQTRVPDLFSKDAILLDQICDDLLLMSAHPSSDGKQHI